MEEKIDFVMIWVDGNDSKWQEEKNKYLGTKKEEINRYRDWDNLQYWFRGVEKFAPWVNKIHFVTYGHLPKWLNVNHPKLNIVKHKDYIPEEYLPTFSSIPIELNLHRIENLSENFVFFNDDTFIVNNIKKEDFFKNGKPRDFAIENAIIALEEKDTFSHVLLNDISLINKNFSKRQVQRKNLNKWLNLKNGKMLLKTLLLLPWKNFTGISYSHLPNAYKKSTFEEVWKKEYEALDLTSKNKFRTKYDVNQYLFEFWQIVKGEIEFRKKDYGECIELTNDTIEYACNRIIKPKTKMICINDSDMSIDFEKAKEMIKQAFEKILPDKSEFEI